MTAASQNAKNILGAEVGLMQRKSRVFGFLFFLLTGAAVGCGDGATPVEGPPQPYKGAVVRVACPAGTPAEVVGLYSRGWAFRNGATLEVRKYETGPGPASVEGADIWVIPPVELPRWAAAARLLLLPPEY